MSVPANQRSQGKLEVCVKAHDLACYTLQITANKKVFEEKFQQSLTDRINATALAVWADVWAANNVLVQSEDDLTERLALQKRAATSCNVLLSLIEIAAKVFHLDGKRVTYWSGKAVSVRSLIRAWRESDRKRYAARLK